MTKLTEEQWEKEMRRRIHIFFCTMYHKKGITISRAQEIFGDFTEADDVIRMLLDRKSIFSSPLSEDNLYEFTFNGTKEFFEVLFRMYEEREGHKPNEEELLKFVMTESKSVAEAGVA